MEFILNFLLYTGAFFAALLIGTVVGICIKILMNMKHETDQWPS